jgi:hypothetical protein
VIPRNIDKGYVALINALEANNAKIITWINNFVEHFIGMQLAKYETTEDFGIIYKCYSYNQILQRSIN